MKSGIGQIIGKSIANVVVATNKARPNQQVFLVFTDDTHLELWGNDFSCGGGLDRGGVSDAIKYAEDMGAEIVNVYPPNK